MFWEELREGRVCIQSAAIAFGPAGMQLSLLQGLQGVKADGEGNLQDSQSVSLSFDLCADLSIDVRLIFLELLTQDPASPFFMLFILKLMERGRICASLC